MNAIEQATTISMATKIATVVNLFQWHFPDVAADLSPWLDSAETRKFDNPNSIDFSFTFPQRHFYCQSRTILLQIAIKRDSGASIVQKLHLEMSGHDAWGTQWQFSTAQKSEFYGINVPIGAAETKLRAICNGINNIFCLDTTHQHR